RFEALIAAKLLTKDRTLNGTTVSKKVRATAPAAVARVEEALAVRRNLERLTKLNEEGRALVDLYRLYVRHRTSLKSQRNVLEFGDLAKCAYRLFKDPEGAGA